MRTRILLFLTFTITLVSLGLTTTVLFNSAPEGIDVLSLFYGSLFISLFGLVFFAFYLLNYFRNLSIPPWQQTVNALRWAGLAGACCIVLLLLQANRVLNIATLMIVLVAIVLLELVLRRNLLNKIRT